MGFYKRFSNLLLFYFLLAVVEGVLTLFFTLSIPSEERSRLVLGYSLPRIFMVIIILAQLLICFWALWHVWRNPARGERLAVALLNQGRWRSMIVWCSKVLVLAVLLVLIAPVGWFEGYRAYIDRLKPYLVWTGLLGVQTLFLVSFSQRYAGVASFLDGGHVGEDSAGIRHKWGAILSLLMFLAVMILPSGVEAWFDGLPWSQPLEFLALAAAFPFLALFAWRFLCRRAVIITLAALLVVKLGLAFYAPCSGWNMYVYASPEAMAQNDWQRTYTTLMYPHLSEIFRSPLRHRLEFPIEWKTVYGYESEKPYLGVALTGFVRLPPDTHLAIVATGLEDGWAKAVTVSGEEWEIPIVNSLESAAQMSYETLPATVVRVNVFLVYGEGNWSLQPVFVFPGGTLGDLHGRGVMWQTAEGAAMPQWVDMALRMIGRILDVSLVIFLLLWLIWGLRQRMLQRDLDHAVILLAIAGCWMLQVLKPFFSSKSAVPVLGVSLLITGALLILWLFRRLRIGLTKEAGMQNLPAVALLVLGAPLLSFYAGNLASEVGRIQIYTTGSDPLTYQVFARQIFVEGDFWHRADAVYAYQPLYRYFAGLLHLLFGQSSAAQNMLDVWSVIGAMMALVSLGGWLQIAPVFSLAGAVLYLAIGWLTQFNVLLGAGMQEYAAMLFVMLTAWSAAQRAFLGWQKILLTSLCGVCGLLLRNDHLGVLGAAALLAIEPLQGSLRWVWAMLFTQMIRQWKTVLIPGIAILGGLLLQALRNYAIGGMFVVNQTQNTTSGWYHSLGERIGGVLLILNSGLSADFFSPGLVFVALVLWAGTLAGVIALVWRRGALARYNLSLAIMLVALLLPYLFFKPTATPPRWSIHLLPLAVLSLSVLAARLFEKANGKDLPQGV
ncbi:MAG: hypothetical protein HPY45_09240 [Anaerolineae bacterium]|nr:hypothetical protein [Anaerolineae bacterium]